MLAFLQKNQRIKKVGQISAQHGKIFSQRSTVFMIETSFNFIRRTSLSTAILLGNNKMAVDNDVLLIKLNEERHYQPPFCWATIKQKDEI